MVLQLCRGAKEEIFMKGEEDIDGGDRRIKRTTSIRKTLLFW